MIIGVHVMETGKGETKCIVHCGWTLLIIWKVGSTKQSRDAAVRMRRLSIKFIVYIFCDLSIFPLNIENGSFNLYYLKKIFISHVANSPLLCFFPGVDCLAPSLVMIETIFSISTLC